MSGSCSIPPNRRPEVIPSLRPSARRFLRLQSKVVPRLGASEPPSLRSEVDPSLRDYDRLLESEPPRLPVEGRSEPPSLLSMVNPGLRTSISKFDPSLRVSCQRSTRASRPTLYLGTAVQVNVNGVCETGVVCVCVLAHACVSACVSAGGRSGSLRSSQRSRTRNMRATTKACAGPDSYAARTRSCTRRTTLWLSRRTCRPPPAPPRRSCLAGKVWIHHMLLLR